MDDVGVSLEKAQEMGKRGDKGDAEEGAPDGAQAAHHHHDDQVQGLEDAETVGVDIAEVMGIKTARHRGEDCGEHEDPHLGPAHVHPQGRSGHFVLGQGGQPATHAAAHQV